MLAVPRVVTDLTAIIGLFLAICAALAAVGKVVKPAVAQMLRAIVQEELAPIVADQAAMRSELAAHLRIEEADVAEIKLALGNEGRIAVRFGEIEHELAKHMEDHRAHMR